MHRIREIKDGTVRNIICVKYNVFTYIIYVYRCIAQFHPNSPFSNKQLQGICTYPWNLEILVEFERKREGEGKL